MRVFNRRNALTGWAVWQLLDRVAAWRNPPPPPPKKRPWKIAAAAAAAVGVAAAGFLRFRKGGES